MRTCPWHPVKRGCTESGAAPETRLTRVLLIHAGPTPWDEVNRLTGAHSLPLSPDAELSIRALVDAMVAPVTGLYLCRDNEACEQAAQIFGHKFGLKLRDRPEFEELHLGLWEGLTRDELRRRFPTVFDRWEVDALAVVPPQGETLGDAIDRVRPALRKVLRRNASGTVALALRPHVMQIVRGLLHGETPQVIASHLHNVDVMETIEIGE
jgi:broad specificity phosphatase PhoE